MAELYTTGVNRIIYQAQSFATGLAVTSYIWSPTLVRSALQTFTEVEMGLYYLDYDFTVSGTWVGLFHEGGVAKTTGIFRVRELGIPKNVALSNFEFLAVESSDHITPATGKTIIAQISKDGGAFANCTNAVAEVGSGVYKINLTQAEMNADIVTLKFTEANCDQRTITLVTN